MKDLEMARAILEEGDSSLVFVKDGKVLYRSGERGISSLYELVRGDYSFLYQASVADKVVGRGAALIYRELSIARLHAGLISDTALDAIGESFSYSYDERTDTIKNRTGEDLCPIEKLSMESEDMEDFMVSLEDFFGKK